MGLSSFASKPLEAVIEAQPQTFPRSTGPGDRDSILARIDRAKRAGACGLILTSDWSFVHSRDWGSPTIPAQVDVKTAIRHAPDVLTRAWWLLDWVRSGRVPDLTVPNFVTGGQPAPGFFEAYGVWMQTPPPTWGDSVAGRPVGWAVHAQGHRPGRPGTHAVDAGVSAISVSNHGGNNLDGTPAPCRMLADIAAAVGGQVEVVMDSGIRQRK